jgi:hypothetical protein
MRGDGIETRILMQERHIVIDAPLGDEQVDGLADGAASFPKRSVTARRPDGPVPIRPLASARISSPMMTSGYDKA